MYIRENNPVMFQSPPTSFAVPHVLLLGNRDLSYLATWFEVFLQALLRDSFWEALDEDPEPEARDAFENRLMLQSANLLCYCYVTPPQRTNRYKSDKALMLCLFPLLTCAFLCCCLFLDLFICGTRGVRLYLRETACASFWIRPKHAKA